MAVVSIENGTLAIEVGLLIKFAVVFSIKRRTMDTSIDKRARRTELFSALPIFKLDWRWRCRRDRDGEGDGDNEREGDGDEESR